MRSTGIVSGVLVSSAFLLAGTARGQNPPTSPVRNPNSGVKREEIKPLPLVPIPDNPPPHEGALINIPYVIEPPDLIDVEVLEGLPGRPINGDRLVRPDGTISLGWYGDVQVRGLTLPQAKVKIVEHLREFIPDDVLGLFEEGEGKQRIPIAPINTSRVFVDVSAHNSKYYYVQGDFGTPGKFPTTGGETVLDAVHYAGGFLHTADPKSLPVIRPARGGKPAKTYAINYEAILEEGDQNANLQLFPGDRLVVGRNAFVQSTVQADRLAATSQTLVNSMLQLSFMSRSVVQATLDLTPAQRETMMKEWFEIFWKSAQRPGGPVADQYALRELILKQLKAMPTANPPGEKK
jgi:polysaccharide export outer membrane protein